MVTAFGDAGAAQAGARLRPAALDTEAALKEALNTDFDQLQAGFDQYDRAHVRQPAERARRARRTSSCRTRRSTTLKHARRREPAKLSRCSSRYGAALAQGRAGRRGDAGLRARRGAGAVAGRHRTARTRSWPRSRSRRRIVRARSPSSRRCSPSDFNNVEAARQLAGAAARGRRRRCREAPAGVRAHRRDRSVRRRGPRRCSAAGAAAQRRGRRGARVPHRHRARPGRSRPRPTPISPRAISRPASGPRPRSRRSPRSRSRRATSARRICC